MVSQSGFGLLRPELAKRASFFSLLVVSIGFAMTLCVPARALGHCAAGPGASWSRYGCFARWFGLAGGAAGV